MAAPLQLQFLALADGGPAAVLALVLDPAVRSLHFDFGSRARSPCIMMPIMIGESDVC